MSLEQLYENGKESEIEEINKQHLANDIKHNADSKSDLLSGNENIETSVLDSHNSKYGNKEFSNGIREWFNEVSGDIVKKASDKVPFLEKDTKKFACDIANNIDIIKEKGVIESENDISEKNKESKYGDKKFDSDIRQFLNQAAGDVVKSVGNFVPFITENEKQEFYDKANNVDIIKEKGIESAINDTVNVDEHKSKYGNSEFNNSIREWFNEVSGDIVKKVGDKIPMLDEDTKKFACDIANNIDIIKEKGVVKPENDLNGMSNIESKYGDKKFDSEIRQFLNQAAGDVVKSVGGFIPFIPENKKQEFYDKANNADIIKEKSVNNINEVTKNADIPNTEDKLKEEKDISLARKIFENSKDI